MDSDVKALLMLVSDFACRPARGLATSLLELRQNSWAVANILGFERGGLSTRLQKRDHLPCFVIRRLPVERSCMIRTTWRYAQRPVMLRFPYINKFSIISYISRTRRLPHRYSTLYAPMTDSVDACNPHPTTSLASDDSISSSSRYNTHCANIDTGLDPRKHTSGRWLRRDELERNSRILNVDFDALRRRVIELCPGATSIARYEKKEGGYNRIFIFTCDNARRVVARLPTSVAGPARLTTNSEVATIMYGEIETSSWTKLSN